jgi:hypothetical protein
MSEFCLSTGTFEKFLRENFSNIRVPKHYTNTMEQFSCQKCKIKEKRYRNFSVSRHKGKKTWIYSSASDEGGVFGETGATSERGSALDEELARGLVDGEADLLLALS